MGSKKLVQYHIVRLMVTLTTLYCKNFVPPSKNWQYRLISILVAVFSCFCKLTFPGWLFSFTNNISIRIRVKPVGRRSVRNLIELKTFANECIALHGFFFRSPHCGQYWHNARYKNIYICWSSAAADSLWRGRFYLCIIALLLLVFVFFSLTYFCSFFFLLSPFQHKCWFNIRTKFSTLYFSVVSFDLFFFCLSRSLSIFSHFFGFYICLWHVKMYSKMNKKKFQQSR